VRQVLFTLKHAFKTKLDRLEELGVPEKANVSEWVTSHVIMHKKNGLVRLLHHYNVSHEH